LRQPRPLAKRRRVILDTDAKNEADDKYAIVRGLLSPNLDVRGIFGGGPIP
jgi:purine nucleosidase